MKIRVNHLLLAAVLILSTLVIGLRGTNPRNDSYQVTGLQTLTSVQGLSLGAMLWSDNFTGAMWHLSSSNASQAVFSQKRSLDLNVTFIQEPTAQAVTVSRSLDLSLDQNPVVVVQLFVSRGIHYGIRFSGINPDGTSFDAWSENSALQHRPGLERWENVSTNLRLQTYLANDQVPIAGSRISHLWLYVEATSGTSGSYSMMLSSIKAFPLVGSESKRSTIGGDLLAVVINLNLPTSNQSLFQVYVDFNIQGSPTLKYTPFLMNGTVVLAQGFDYVQNVVTPYESAVLTTSLVSGFPTFLPDGNRATIVVATSSGLIHQFSLVNLSFKYTSTPFESGGYIDPNLARQVLIYYVLFLFATPIAAVILIERCFKTEA